MEVSLRLVKEESRNEKNFTRDEIVDGETIHIIGLDERRVGARYGDGV